MGRGRFVAGIARDARGRFVVTILVVAGVVLGMSSAAWACHPVLSGVARCTQSGDQLVTWTIGNSQFDQPMTITAASAQVGSTFYAVTGYSTVVPDGGSTSATTTLPSHLTGTVVLSVTGKWSHRLWATRQTSVELGGMCSPPTTTTTTTTVPPTTTTTTVPPTTTTTTEPPPTTTTEQSTTSTTESPTTTILPPTSTTVGPTSTTTTEPTTTSTNAPTGTTVRSQGSTVPSTTPSSPTTPGPGAGSLPRTGANGWPVLIGLGSMLLGLGAFALRSFRFSMSIRTPHR
jgi:LPXTG-motif cell wall-anchored protein